MIKNIISSVFTCALATGIMAVTNPIVGLDNVKFSDNIEQEYNEVIELREVLDEVNSEENENIVLKLNSREAYVNNTRSDLTSRSGTILRDDGRAMIPLRFLVESMNANITYNYGQQKITIKYDNIIYTIYLDTNKVLKNGVLIEDNLITQNIDNSLYVSIRQIVDIFNISIDYKRKDSADYIVVTKNESETKTTSTPTKIETIDVENTYLGFIRPVTGVDRSYMGDSGLDIWCPIGTPVYAIADCYINYSEYGHTPWTGENDTAYSIMATFDKPVEYNGITLKSVFYTHLSQLVYSGSPGRMIHQGELIGYSGIANGTPHLHFEILQTDNVPMLRDIFQTANFDNWIAGK